MEDAPDLVAGDFATFRIGFRLHNLGELDLEFPRQIQGVIGFEEVGDPTFPGL